MSSTSSSFAALAAALLALGALGCAHAGPPRTDPIPVDAALSARLEPAARTLDSAIAAGAAPGAVLAVSLGGQHFEHAIGQLAVDDRRPPDGRTLYHTDTLGGFIYACDVSDEGRLSNRRLFAAIPNAEGYPDGPTVDAEGCVWTGLYKGDAVRRYSPRGELLETVRFPVSAITKIAFGGPELKTVFCSTAAKHLSAEEAAAEPCAGDLYQFNVSVPGLPGHEIKVGV